MEDNQVNQPAAAAPQFPRAFDLLKPSWEAVKTNGGFFAFYLGVSVLLTAITVIANGSFSASANGTSQMTPVGLIVYILTIIFSLVMSPALIIALLKGAKGEQAGVSELIKAGLPFIWRNIGLSIVSALIIVIGFILLIVPGFFMYRRYMLAPYYLIDRNLSIGAALKASKTDSVRFSGAVWGIIGVMALIGLVSIVPIIGWIGAVVMYVAYLAAPALRYLQFKSVTTQS